MEPMTASQAKYAIMSFVVAMSVIVIVPKILSKFNLSNKAEITIKLMVMLPALFNLVYFCTPPENRKYALIAVSVIFILAAMAVVVWVLMTNALVNFIKQFRSKTSKVNRSDTITVKAADNNTIKNKHTNKNTISSKRTMDSTVSYSDSNDRKPPIMVYTNGVFNQEILVQLRNNRRYIPNEEDDNQDMFEYYIDDKVLRIGFNDDLADTLLKMGYYGM